MARSVRAAAAALALALPLAGCTSTQHEAQRLQLDAARLRAALLNTRVTLANPQVTATTIGVVRGPGGTAIVVTVRNRGNKPVTDLPISVGYANAAGRRVYLNAQANLNYFQAHLPAIAAGRSLAWVFATNADVPNRSQPFAIVGTKPSAPARLTETSVRIAIRYGDPRGARSVMVHLDNPTDVPQYLLQVYAYARHGGRYVAAGGTTVAELDGGAKVTLRLPLVGSAPSANLHVEAIPTILQ